LTFIIVPVLAYFFAGEPLTLRTLAGAAVIMLGVLISVR
jgi:drug/metabolite transporter (DMT)-like permease